MALPHLTLLYESSDLNYVNDYMSEVQSSKYMHDSRLCDSATAPGLQQEHQLCEFHRFAKIVFYKIY